MSGHDVPYQLRPNKFVERQLFLDILDFVRVWNGSSKYIYAAMGGRFLEDFRQVNTRFAIEHMISIESDPTTCQRQAFNRLGFIECRNESSGDFVEKLDKLVGENPDHHLVVWLDFTEANKRGQQLGEFRQLVSRLASGDVAKITLNANSQSFRRRASPLTRKDFDQYLKKPELETHKDFETYVSNAVTLGGQGPQAATDSFFATPETDYETICIENLKEQLGDYMPLGGMTAEHLQTAEFAAFLAEAVKVAALKGAENTKLHVIPLGVFRYQDGEHQMVTVSTIIANDDLAKQIRDDGVFNEWPFRATDWNAVLEIKLPDMSAKERHYLEGLITTEHDPVAIHGAMPFRFARQEAISLSLLQQYLRHYRRYPAFVRSS